MQEISKIWRQRFGDPELVNKLAQELGISKLITSMLISRKINKLEQAQKYLKHSFSNLRDPKSFKNLESAAQRICQSIVNQEIIGIFGDYDVDGVSSTALMTEFLRDLGAQVVYTLPHRMTEGYGLSIAGIDRLAKLGAKLIITVDCGSTNISEVNYGAEKNLEFIIIDHHEVGKEKPNCYAMVNPKQPGCDSKASHLCAAGVAFYVCIGIRKILREQEFFKNKPEPDLKKILDLVALATVCDVVPLKEENRIFVAAGLFKIKQGQRIGLDELIKISGVDKQKIRATNLGFHVGPRINAAGRLDYAQSALELMLAQDKNYAQDLAQKLDQENQSRKDIEQEITEQVCEIINNSEKLQKSPVLVVYSESFHPGVVGIVSSRISEKYHKPSIIIGTGKKGSGRSIFGVDLFKLVNQASDLLAGFGGHSHAIGLTLGESGYEKFFEKLTLICEKDINPSVFDKILFYDCELKINQINFDLVDELARLEPYGAQNPYPVIKITNSHVRNLRVVGQAHLKGELESSSGSIEFIFFAHTSFNILAHEKLDILGIVEKNSWRGQTRLQIRILDYKKSPT